MPAAAPANKTHDWRFFGNTEIDQTAYMGIPKKLRKTSDRGLARLADNQIKYSQATEFYRYVLQWTDQVPARYLNRWAKHPCKAMDQILSLAYTRYRNCVKRGGFKVKDNMKVTLVSQPFKLQTQTGC